MSETVPSNHYSVDQDSLQTVMKIPDGLDMPDIKDEFITKYPESGLGREAILRSLYSTEEIIDNDDKNRFIRKFINMFDKKSTREKAKEIQTIRESLNALSPEYAREIFDQMDNTFIRNAIFPHDLPSEVSWMGNPLGERFVAIKNKNKHAVSDETVLNFAQWYMGLTLDKQKEYDAEISGFREQYKDRVRSAVDAGWIPTRVINNLRNIDNTDVIQDDMFATIANGAHGWYDAYSSIDVDGRSTILVSPIETEQSTKDETLTHEWTHALANDTEEKYNRTRLLRELFGEAGSFTINEGLTEHLAQSLIHGDFDTIDPGLRTPKGSSYAEFRTLLDKICNGGNVKIDIREFYDALYFTSQEKKNLFIHSESTRNLFKKIEDSFPGVNVLTRLSNINKDNDFDNLLDDLNTFATKKDIKEKHPEYISL